MHTPQTHVTNGGRRRRLVVESAAVVVGQTTIAAMLLMLAACDRPLPPLVSGSFPQRGYLWQREWSPAVVEAYAEGAKRCDGVVILGGEIVWNGTTPRLIKSSVDWALIARSGKPCGLGLRIAPHSGTFAGSEPGTRFIIDTAQALLREAAERGVTIGEFQLDFDSPQRKLADYRSLLGPLRAALRPVPLTITALPSWLEEPEFPRLLNEVDEYVLQVHSVPTQLGKQADRICDPVRARQWTARAASFGRPFTVALPTYRCIAGFDEQGKLLGVAMDALQPSWPAGTRVLEFASEPRELARLIQEWKATRPANMTGVIWYRLPTAADVRNWRWPTLSAVMEGREPLRQLEIRTEGASPVDIYVINKGEADEHLTSGVVIAWDEANLIASDVLQGWTLQTREREVEFAPTGEAPVRLLPGERRDVGWLRYDRAPRLESRFVSRPSPAR